MSTITGVAAAVKALIPRIRLIVFDFDGVFTDNTVIVSQEGTESVVCWRGDGLGLARLRKTGIDALIVSTETNPVVVARSRKLGLECRNACEHKPSILTEVTAARGISLDQVAFVGNDVNDLECLKMVALPIVVADAHADVVRVALWRTDLPGGRGAVREICDTFVRVIAGHS